jgi:hypothetical protein
MADAHLSLDGRSVTIHVPMIFKTRGGRKLVISPDGVPSWAIIQIAAANIAPMIIKSDCGDTASKYP